MLTDATVGMLTAALFPLGCVWGMATSAGIDIAGTLNIWMWYKLCGCGTMSPKLVHLGQTSHPLKNEEELLDMERGLETIVKPNYHWRPQGSMQGGA